MTRRSLRLADGHGMQDESEKRNSDGYACWVLTTTAVPRRFRILSSVVKFNVLVLLSIVFRNS
jgi:hypothetical protein